MTAKILGLLCMLDMAAAALAQEPMTVSRYEHLPAAYELVNTAYGQFPATFISPHTQWAKDLPGGEPRLLAVLPTWASREALELKERFPCQLSLVMTRSHQEWAVPNRGEPYGEVDPREPDRIALTLLNRPEKFDAIIIGKIAWTAIPEPVRQLILDRVATGCGLVYVGPQGLDQRLEKLRAAKAVQADVPRITEGVPLGMLPLEDKRRGQGPLEVTAAQYGQGRVVMLDYRDEKVWEPPQAVEWRMPVGPENIALTPFVEDDPLFYDYYYSLLAKAVLWAARKEPAARLAARPAPLEIDQAKLPAAVPLFTIAEALPAGCAGWLEFRDREGRLLFGRPVAVGAATEVAVELPRVKTGLYVADLWLRKEGGVVNWASAAVRVTGPQYIGEIAAQRRAFGRGEPIRGSVRLTEPLPAGCRLRVELADTYGRIAARAELSSEGRECAFSLDLKHPLSRVYGISAAVVDAGGEREEKTLHVGVPDREVRDYVSLLWASGILNRTQSVLREQCRRFEVDAFYDGSLYLKGPEARRRALTLARNNLAVEPYTQNISVGEWHATTAELLRDCVDPLLPRAEAFAPYGVLGYSICEENSIAKTDKLWGTPPALGEYRRWAQQQFGSLEKANQVWGTALGSWDDLGLVSLAEARRRDRFPLWVSQQRYRQDLFMRIHEAAASRLREGDPAARITLDCIDGCDFDWPRAAEFVQGGYAAPALTPFVSCRSNSFFGEGIGWNPGQLDRFRMKFYPWKGLLDGGQMIFWWPVGFYTGLGGAAAFTPDASEPLLCFAQMCDEVRTIHHGVGALLIQSRKDEDPIVMNHSTLSYYASVLSRRETTWEDSQKMFHRVLSRIGRTARELSPRQMQELRYGDDARVLILPYSQSMTEGEIAAVRRFADEGGLVIADFQPALFDEHCRPYGKAEVVRPGREVVCPKCAGKMRYEEATATVTRWVPCPVCAATGKILEGREVRYTGSRLEQFFGGFTPMNLRSHGKGWSLYLGKTLGEPGDWEGLASLLDRHGGLKRRFVVLDSCGNRRTDLLTAQFTNGTARYFAFLPERLVADPPGPVTTVRLPEKRHVYDVLRQDYLGDTDTLTSGAVPAVPKIFAALPCKLDALGLEIGGREFRPGDEVPVAALLTPAAIAGAGLCVRFEVYDPAGKPLDCCTRKVISRTGRFEMVLPLAFNDAAGRYRVTAEEIASGLRARGHFDVTRK